jgi:hypothetical protein
LIRDRIAMAVIGVTVGALPIFALLATVESTRRPADVVLLWLAGLLQLGLLGTWAVWPRMPKWIVAGWGLVLAAAGLGIAIAGPVSDGPGSATPWGLVGLLVVGIATMIAAPIHSPTGGASQV